MGEITYFISPVMELLFTNQYGLVKARTLCQRYFSNKPPRTPRTQRKERKEKIYLTELCCLINDIWLMVIDYQFIFYS
ncbi:hypothetical protein CEN44_28725 [Fischerella muscicola CCMEE 5323]|uniref:Uncharacterized protein n=1 Tax=Fischerella muscicola CCMEE 5323 TaxID=2019572 RepID=A0A2N6JUG2_FISMU|nr:hypothetical protein CEN44_28725 [Fischerella muscicola CCMEE 5323]